MVSSLNVSDRLSILTSLCQLYGLSIYSHNATYYVKNLRLAFATEYRIWDGMRRRCKNNKDQRYQYYGGRGISVCDRWKHSFECFLLDMGPRPSNEHSIDRIDNDGNYEPENCRWATRSLQTHNQHKIKGITSRYRGVFFDRSRNKWVASVRLNSAVIRKSRHNTELEAARTYDDYARLTYGSNANLNFPREDYQ